MDLVIWNEDREGYRQLLQEQIMGLIAWGVEAHVIDRPGGIFVRHADQISSEDRILIQSVARVIITDSKGSLTDQVNRRGLLEVRVPPSNPATSRPNSRGGLLPRDDLILFNGLGGFTLTGAIRDYPNQRPDHTRAVGQCTGKSSFGTSFPKAGKRIRGAKMPTNPPDPVA